MSKELEALEEIRDFRYGEDKLLVCQTEMYSTIKNALQRLEAIENTEPSEALKCLEKIKDSFGCDMAYYNLNSEYETVEKALIKALDQEKENTDYGSARERWKIICQTIKRMFDFDIEEKWSGDDKVITQTLIKSQEQAKVLEIIKEKDVDVFRFKKLDFNTFNQLQKSCRLPEITEQEFELLKRWLRNDR